MSHPTRLAALGLLATVLAPALAEGDRRGLRGIAADLEWRELLGEVDANRDRQAQLEQETQQIDAAERDLHTTLEARVHALYRLTRHGMAPVLGGFDAVRNHVTRVHRLRALVENDAQTWAELEVRRSAARAELELKRATLIHARERLQALESEGVLARTSIDGFDQTRASTAAFDGLEHSVSAARDDTRERDDARSPVDGGPPSAAT
ncbi:MAG: hypothetical protein ABW321_27645, partial [Polyangiales bacterium]